MRLNNYISSTGLCSRREADKLIEQGRVTVNGKKAQVGQTVEEGAMVKVNNKLIKPKNKNFQNITLPFFISQIPQLSGNDQTNPQSPLHSQYADYEQ